MQVQSKTKGFTLVELLVVIAIIGLLAGVMIVNVNSARAKARDAQRISDARAVQTANQVFMDGNEGAVAVSLEELASDEVALLGEVPTDPRTGDPYDYARGEGEADNTFYMAFTTEQDSSLGEAGNYCVTSRRIVARSGETCPLE